MNGKKSTVAAKPKTDLEIVCRLEPGYGAAFKKMREAAGLSQGQLAELIECGQSAISHWESERYKPEPEILRKALEAMGADPRTLFRYFELPPEMRAAIASQLSPEDMAIALGKILLDSISNEQAMGSIFDFAGPKVLAAVSIKALHDVQAAKLFFERQDKHRDQQSPRRRLESAIDVTPSTQFLPQARQIDEGHPE